MVLEGSVRVWLRMDAERREGRRSKEAKKCCILG